MKKILIALGLALLALVIYLGYSGLFISANIVEKDLGPYHLVYLKHKGDYKGIRKVQMDVYQAIVKSSKAKPTIGFGIYYDNPAKVAKEKLRSEGGCIVSKEEFNKIKKAKPKIKLLFKKLESSKYAVSEFPYKNNFSVLFGILKSYPKLNEYQKNKGYKQTYSIEMYDVPNKKLIFAFPIVIKKK